MFNSNLCINKLIILYMLNIANMPLTNSFISEYILALQYTNYFALQEYINQLNESDLIAKKIVSNNTVYEITDLGITTLDFFGNRIPTGTKDNILEYLKSNKYSIKESLEIISEYFQTENDECLVHCVAKENDKILLDMRINVVDKEYAIKICDKWKDNSEEIYQLIMNRFLN